MLHWGAGVPLDAARPWAACLGVAAFLCDYKLNHGLGDVPSAHPQLLRLPPSQGLARVSAGPACKACMRRHICPRQIMESQPACDIQITL